MNATTYEELPTQKRPMSYFYKAGCAAEFKLMRLRELPMAQPLVDTPERAYEFHREHVQPAPWYDTDKEAFVALFLDTRRRICGFALIALGSLDTVCVHAREVFRPAIIHGTSAIIMMHNHPSGDPTPSEADIRVTRDLIRAGQLLKIEVLDHVIAGRQTPERSQGYVSLRELGYFL
jgi:DNA repair protein RadC